MRRLLVLLAAGLPAMMVGLLATGCGATVEVQGTLPAQKVRLAVLDFDDSAAYKAVRDYSVGGASGTEHPGALVSRAVRRALAKCPDCAVMDWHDMRRIMGPDKPLTAAADSDALDMARRLGVDAVVRGEVQSYRQVWVLQLIGWASVDFTARGLDVGTGKELWRAHAEGRRMGAVEEDVADDLCRQVRERLIENSRKARLSAGKPRLSAGRSTE